MPDRNPPPAPRPSRDSLLDRPVRELADGYVAALAELDPLLSTSLGLRPGEDRMPDFSPSGQQARDDLARATLAELDSAELAAAARQLRTATPGSPDPEAAAGGGDAAGTPGGGDAAAAAAGRDAAAALAAERHERRCARLLRERLEAGLATSETGEHLRMFSNILGPVQQVRGTFQLMPTVTEDDWSVVARRMRRVPEALASYRESLAEGARRGLLAAPRQVVAQAVQLGDWLAAGGGRGYFAEFAAAAGVSPPLRADLDGAAATAISSVAELRRWLTAEYLPRADGTPDGVGPDRYLVAARQWTGASLDPAEAYDWGWSQFLELRDDLSQQAQLVLPGATAAAAMRHLDEHGDAVTGVEQIRLRLQRMLDEAVAILDGTHFDLADPLRVVEARIAPAGSAAAPYYTPPSRDFSRPGRTWLPTLGRTRFPLWNLVSTWYHEGVPGHHLQHGQWRYLSGRLSLYQTSVGSVSACSEGWALYAERLMSELGYVSGHGPRLGYLRAQLARAIRVVVDIGMHLGLEVPAGWPAGAGQTWTPELATEFCSAHSGRDPVYVDSEIVRYLGRPGQAISYKLGERAWLAGREAARSAWSARGRDFDLKAWHMAALSLGSLGLDDLAGELARL
jgi:uncharacterized protein (DUF885 family)